MKLGWVFEKIQPFFMETVTCRLSLTDTVATVKLMIAEGEKQQGNPFLYPIDMLEHQLSFFFSAVGVFNGILAWIYLQFFTRHRNTVHTLGCLILLMFCIRVGVSCIYFFTPDLSPYFIQLGLSAHYMIGPLVWAFTTLHLDRVDGRRLRHVTLHVWIQALVITVFGFLFRFEDHFFVWDHRIRYVIHAHLSIYLLLTTFRLFPVIKKLFTDPASLDTNALETLAVFFLTIIICLGFVVSLYTNYIIGPVFTSIIFYGVAISVFAGRKRIQELLKKASKYKNRKIEDAAVSQLKQELKRLMKDEALYRTPNLKIDALADRMDVGVNLLSQFMNEHVGQNFASFINAYRVAEAQQLLLAKDLTHLTIEAIGYEVGFNSKSAFYTAFKKQTGKTPVAFRNHPGAENTGK